MKWAKKYISIYNQPLDNVHEGIIQEIKQKLAKVQSDEPVVTVSVIAYNEERHLLPCLLYTSPSPRDISGSRMPSSA